MKFHLRLLGKLGIDVTVDMVDRSGFMRGSPCYLFSIQL